MFKTSVVVLFDIALFLEFCFEEGLKVVAMVVEAVCTAAPTDEFYRLV